MKFKMFLAICLLVPGFAFAQEEKAAKSTPDATTSSADHIKMHEAMAKSHADAASCLKAGKNPEECRQAFRKSCQDSNAPGMCGAGMGPGMGHKMKQKMRMQNTEKTNQ